MNFYFRFIPLIVLVLFAASSLCAQESLSIRNDEYRYGLRSAGGVQLFVVEGIAPVLAEEIRIPKRIVRIPVSENAPFDVRLANAVLTQAVAGSPFYRYIVTMAPDSTLRSELAPADVPAAERGGMTAAILSKRYSRERGSLELVLELPLLEWNPATNDVRWIEEYVFERFIPQGIINSIPMASEGKPPYATQPFTTRSRNVDTSQAWIDFGNPMLRFFVRTDGLYKVTADWLRESGFDPASMDPSSVQLYRKGVAVPLYLHGMDDGRFDDGDYILFYGTKNYNELGHRRISASPEDPYPQYISIYTDSTAYWFNFNTTNPTRIRQLDLRAQGITDTVDWAYRNVHMEYDYHLWNYATSVVRAQIPDWSAELTYFIGEMRPGQVARDRFTVDNLVLDQQARAWCKMASWFGDAAISPNHSATLAVNTSASLDSVVFSLDQQALSFAEFPSNLLFNGIDTVKLISHNIQGTGSSSIAVDWYEVEYPRYLVADGRQFIFGTDPAQQLRPSLLKIQTAIDSEHFLLRIGEASSVILPLHDKQQAQDARYIFADSLLARSTYIFCPTDSVLLPGAGERRVIEPLIRPDQQAAYLIITAESLLEPSLEYASFIEQSYGVTTRVATIERIYDVYSYGMFQPEAIKLLIFDAYHAWQSDSLRNLFLIGDANANYKWTGAKYSKNIVPSYGSPVSDIWFVCFDSLQIVPSLPVGRLAARTAEEIRAYRQKHAAYIAHPMDLWNKSTLHFSGGDLNRGNSELMKFKGINQVVVDNVVRPRPFSGQATHFYKTLDPQSDFGPYPESFVNQRIQDGGVFISYVGHSGTATWDNSISVASDLHNKEGRASLVTDFGCSTGRFAEADIVSFSEAAVVSTDGEFIGYIGNASAGFESTTSTLPYIYYNELIRERAGSVGKAHIKSKLTLQELYGTNIINTISTLTNLLIGDPIVKIALPEKPNLVVKDWWMKIEEEIITDQMDSIICRIVVGNYGIHVSDSVDVHVEHEFLGQPLAVLYQRIEMPDIYDTLRFTIPMTRESGNGLLRVTIDRDNVIDEIYDNDNTASLRYDVFSTFMKVVDERLEVTRGGNAPIRVLNPVYSPGQVENMLVEFDASPDFPSPVQRRTPYGSTLTETVFESMPSDVPTFWRARLEGGNGEFIGPYKRNSLIEGDFIQADSAEFLRSELSELRIENDAITVMPGELLVQAESAGFPTKYLAIRLNGINIVKTTFFRGYAIAVFDSLTMKLKRFAQFDNWGIAAHRDSIKTWIEGVKTGEIVVVTTADEPQSGSNVFNAAMKSIGSVLIDSVRIRNRSSWAIIGHKGAAAGSVPEVFHAQGELVSTQQSFPVLPDTGIIVSPLVGPSTAWQSVRLLRSPIATSDIRISVIGVDTAGMQRRLIEGGNVDSVSLASIDAALYPYVRFEAALVPDGNDPPELRAWAFSYAQPAELAMNYQSLSIVLDSVIQATPLQISFGLLNAGESEALNVPVHMDVIGSDNIPRTAAMFSIPRIASRARFDSTVNIPTESYSGTYQLRIVVDRDNTILEQHEDNNSFITSFHIKADTTRPQMDIAFDGYLPVDGDYIRYNPEIVLTLRTPPPFPISEKEKFRVTIDGDELSLDSLSASFTPSTRETPAVLRFQPNLADGEYYFGFNAVDGDDQPVYEEDLEIRVRVSSQSRIAELYNYPNPFAGETSFTFLLTGAGVPDEVQVKVYTVAGRLIRTLSYPASSVRIGYNALKWDGKDEDGDTIANGVYFYKLISRFTDATVEEIGRMSVLK